MMLTAIGILCAAVSIINITAALYFAMNGQELLSLLLTANFAFLGCMVQVGTFG